MGYTTEYYGQYDLDRKLSPAHAAYLRRFNETRRMKRDVSKALSLPDPVRAAAMLPIGLEAGYFVGGLGDFGQGNDPSIIEYNHPPAEQPGLWNHWIPNEADNGIVWDEGEKFYSASEWLVYLYRHFLYPWQYLVNGHTRWQGDDNEDYGILLFRTPIDSPGESILILPQCVWDDDRLLEEYPITTSRKRRRAVAPVRGGMLPPKQ
jgi:hypothetical protein